MITIEEFLLVFAIAESYILLNRVFFTVIIYKDIIKYKYYGSWA